MNSRTFSCGKRSRTWQHVGNVRLESAMAESEVVTCNPVYTKRPHWLAGGCPMGALNVK